MGFENVLRLFVVGPKSPETLVMLRKVWINAKE